MKNTSSLFHHECIIPMEYVGQRFDQVLARLIPEHSRSRLQAWLRQESITLNGEHYRASYRIQGNEYLVIHASIAENQTWCAQKIPLIIIAEDEAIIVINKPAGLVTHPAAGNRENTLANALLHHAPQLASVPRAGIVHRLDKETSGLLVIAKTVTAHTYLVAQLQSRQVHREYYAVINGVLTAGGTVNAPIGRHSQQRQKMAVAENGKSAITHYRIVQRFRAHTLIKVLLETGRTHQIRVHMAHLHHPLVGDHTYGSRPIIPAGATQELITAVQQFKRQALHALHLNFMHPITQQLAHFSAPLPPDMQKLIALLKADVAR